MSMIKRRQGEAVWSRGEAGWMRDMRIMVLARNIMIYWSVQSFLQSKLTPFSLDTIFPVRTQRGRKGSS